MDNLRQLPIEVALYSAGFHEDGIGTNEKPLPGPYPDRVAGGSCYYHHPRCDVAASPVEGPSQGQANPVPQQHEAGRHRHALAHDSVPGRAQRDVRI